MRYIFRFRPERAVERVTLRGDFVDWLRPHPMCPGADGTFETALDLAPGVYAYKFALGEAEWACDRANPRTECAAAFFQNSLLVAGGTEEPVVHAPARPYLFRDDQGRVLVRARLRRGAGEGLDLIVVPEEGGERRTAMRPCGEDVEHRRFEAVLEGGAEGAGGAAGYLFEVRGPGRAAGLRCGRGSALGLFEARRAALPALAPQPFAGRSIYRIVLDRFRAGGGRPLGAEVGPEVERRAGGDLRGVIDALPHLFDLGVEAILLTPLGRSPSYHRYDLCEPLALDPALGTEEDLRALVAGAHARGIAVLLDGAVSHVNPDFFAFRDVVARGEASPYRDWFFIRRFPVVVDPDDPAFRHYPNGPHLPLLNTDHPEVLSYLEGYFRRWTGFGIDGWRLDAVADVERAVFERLGAAIREVNPRAVLLSELVPDGAPRYLGRPGEVVTEFPTSNAIVRFFCHAAIGAEEFRAALEARRFQFGADPERMLLFLADLDQDRPLTVCRLPALVRLAALFLLTVPATPLVLYGDEVGLTSGRPASEFERGTDRVPMPWGEDAAWDRATLAAFRELLWLRREEPALAGHDFEIPYARDRAIAWSRSDGVEEAIGTANLSNVAVEVPLGALGGARLGGPLFTEGAVAVRGEALVLGPRSGALFVRARAAETSGPAPRAAPAGERAPADRAMRNLARADRAFRGGRVTLGARPSRYYLNLTERCNLRCAHCITDAPARTAARSARDMDPRVLERLAPYLGDALYVGLVHAGEPTIAPLLEPLLERLAAERRGGPAVVHLLTNGMTLSPERLGRLAALGVRSLSISIDGASAATNDALRVGSRFERLRDLLPELARARRERGLPVRMGVAYTVTASNVHETAEAVRMVAAAGLDWVKLEEMYPVNERSRREAEIAPERLAAAVEAARAVANETGVVLLEHLESPRVLKCRLGLPPVGGEGASRRPSPAWGKARAAPEGRVVMGGGRRGDAMEGVDPAVRRFSLGDDFVNRLEINPCRFPFELACIEPDGDVKPLSFHFPPAGNLIEEDLLEIWNGPLFRSVREASLRTRPCGRYGAFCSRDPGPEGW